MYIKESKLQNILPEERKRLKEKQIGFSVVLLLFYMIVRWETMHFIGMACTSSQTEKREIITD